MGDQNKYWERLLFHERLEETILDNYNIKPRWSKVIGWGYKTTAVYLESEDGKKYIVKLSRSAQRYISSLKKDIFISNYVRSFSIPSPQYLQNKKGEFLTKFQDYQMRLQYHIEGVPPYDINKDIINQIVEVLKKFHSLPIPDYKFMTKKFPINAQNLKSKVLLHGDLTLENVLISYGKLTGILDFENTFTGPIEWDLSKLGIYSWIHEHETPYDEWISFILEKYNNPKIETGAIFVLSRFHLESHIGDLNKKLNKTSTKKAQSALSLKEQISFFNSVLENFDKGVRIP